MKEHELAQFGLNEYESKAYYTLLSQEMIGAGELSKLANIPQGRIYSVLNGLIEKGFCTLFPDSVKKYQAIHPKIALKAIISDREEQLKSLKTTTEELSKAFDSRKVNDIPTEYIQILTSKQSQIEKFDELITMATKTLYSFNKRPYATGFLRNLKEIDQASKPLKRILKNGTSVKAIFEREEEHTEEFLAMLNYYESIGEEVRISNELPLKMLIADKGTAMVSLRNNHSSKFKLSSMVVEHSDLSNAFGELFDMYWNVSTPLKTYKQEIKANSEL